MLCAFPLSDVLNIYVEVIKYILQTGFEVKTNLFYYYFLLVAGFFAQLISNKILRKPFIEVASLL